MALSHRGLSRALGGFGADRGRDLKIQGRNFDRPRAHRARLSPLAAGYVDKMCLDSTSGLTLQRFSRDINLPRSRSISPFGAQFWASRAEKTDSVSNGALHASGHLYPGTYRTAGGLTTPNISMWRPGTAEKWPFSVTALSRPQKGGGRAGVGRGQVWPLP